LKIILPGIFTVVLALFIAQRFFPEIQMNFLTVVTIPGGSQVFINGDRAGVSPLTRFVPGNRVFVRAEKEGFVSRDSLFQFSSDTLFLQLQEKSLLVINTDPPSCRVFSGSYSGVSPCSISVVPGIPVEITVIGELGILVSRTLNILTPGTRLVNITMPREFTDSASGSDFMVISEDLLPFPLSTVTVGKSEVTAEQFAAFMNYVDPDMFTDYGCLRGRTCLMDSILICNWKGPVAFNSDNTAYSPLPGMENHPMVGVTRAGAEWYCRWLSSISETGLEYRLPSREEWENLALAGGGLAVNLSDVNETILMRHPEINDGWARTAPAGSMGASPWGLYDMQGNVWEWTSSEGIAMGGSWLSSREDCRAGSFTALDNQLGYPFVGFRVVASGCPSDSIQAQ
jgi:hypothetical protein